MEAFFTVNLDKSVPLLQSVLDFLEHPAWITDSQGRILLNEQAQNMVSEGVVLPKPRRNGYTGATIKGKKFRVRTREVNHGTDCFFHELEIEDDPCRRLKESTNRLTAALENRK